MVGKLFPFGSNSLFSGVDLLLVSGSVIYQAKKQAPFLLRRFLDLTNSSENC